jgi:hypothetical protein
LKAATIVAEALWSYRFAIADRWAAIVSRCAAIAAKAASADTSPPVCSAGAVGIASGAEIASVFGGTTGAAAGAEGSSWAGTFAGLPGKKRRVVANKKFLTSFFRRYLRFERQCDVVANRRILGRWSRFADLAWAGPGKSGSAMSRFMGYHRNPV